MPSCQHYTGIKEMNEITGGVTDLQALLKQLVSTSGAILILIRIGPVSNKKVEMLEWLLVCIFHSQPTILREQLQCIYNKLLLYRF